MSSRSSLSKLIDLGCTMSWGKDRCRIDHIQHGAILQIPVTRIHTDRAKEFVSYQTYTAGDEASGNARTERAIGLIKSRARVMLQAAEVGLEMWPLAIRQAGEELFRHQLRQLGVPAPPILSFGAQVVVKRKAWHRRGILGQSNAESSGMGASRRHERQLPRILRGD